MRISVGIGIAALVIALTGPALAQGVGSYPGTADQIQPATVSEPQEFTNKAGGAGMFEIQSSQMP